MVLPVHVRPRISAAERIQRNTNVLECITIALYENEIIIRIFIRETFLFDVIIIYYCDITNIMYVYAEVIRRIS